MKKLTPLQESGLRKIVKHLNEVGEVIGEPSAEFLRDLARVCTKHKFVIFEGKIVSVKSYVNYPKVKRNQYGEYYELVADWD